MTVLDTRTRYTRASNCLSQLRSIEASLEYWQKNELNKDRQFMFDLILSTMRELERQIDKEELCGG